MTTLLRRVAAAVILTSLLFATASANAEDWLQLKFDARHSGNAIDRSITTPLGLVGTVPLTDAVFTSPVIQGGHIYVLDGSGVASCIDAESLRVVWQYQSPGGPANCNNVSSPAIVGPYLHFGTTAGSYYVLDRQDGSLVKRIACHDPIFSAPVVVGERVYFATLGAQLYAVTPSGDVRWSWDFVKEVIGFEGDRWNGEDWYAFKEGRVTWQDHFCCSQNISAFGDTLVMPAGGRTVFLKDAGGRAELLSVAEIPSYAGTEYAAAFGQSIGEQGEVYVQWHRRDNAGRVEVLKLDGDELQTDFVPGTQTAINLQGLMGFCSVSMRGSDVFRCRPEEAYGFCKHSSDSEEVQYLGGPPSIASPILLRDQGVYGALDGSLNVVPLSGQGKAWSFQTAQGKPITAPVAVCDGRIYFGCEDGYLYILGPNGTAPLPTKDLAVQEIRSPLTSRLPGAEFNWYANYGDSGHTNWNDQGIEPPLKIRWIRRYQGTFKHLPVCGGGRMYTHTAEGQVIALEQETGRLLWRSYWPGVYLSFTSPVYFEADGKQRLLVPQAGMDRSRMRCLDAATGQLLWEAPFTGSPSWSRQEPPVVHDGLAIYASGSGKYVAQGTEKAYVQKGDPEPRPDGDEVMSWVYTHNNPYYPKDHKPQVWAWDVETGELAWSKDFSRYGAGGNDCGVCLMDGTLYYSTFFGYAPNRDQRRGTKNIATGMTAAINPTTGDPQWVTTDYSVTAGCSISAADGCLYLGGYNQPNESTQDRFIFCLNATDGSLKWKSPPLESAVNIITVADDFLFSNARGRLGQVLDKQSGEILSSFDMGYACTRFTVSGTYLLGTNMDIIDLAQENRLIASGPCIDSRECVASVVSNGRLFYTSQASGIQVSLSAGEEARALTSPWEK